MDSPARVLYQSACLRIGPDVQAALPLDSVAFGEPARPVGARRDRLRGKLVLPAAARPHPDPDVARRAQARLALCGDLHAGLGRRRDGRLRHRRPALRHDRPVAHPSLRLCRPHGRTQGDLCALGRGLHPGQGRPADSLQTGHHRQRRPRLQLRAVRRAFPSHPRRAVLRARRRAQPVRRSAQDRSRAAFSDFPRLHRGHRRHRLLDGRTDA